MAFNLATGKPAWPSGDKQKTPGQFYLDDAVMMHPIRLNRGLGVPRFTMTVYRGRIYARMGSQVTSRTMESPESYGGHLVCLDLAAQGRLCWKISADDEKWSFEGAPVVDGSDVYVAMRKSDVRPQAHVACFDAETGQRALADDDLRGGNARRRTERRDDAQSAHAGAGHALLQHESRRRGGRVGARRPDKWVTLYPRAKRTSSFGLGSPRGTFLSRLESVHLLSRAADGGPQRLRRDSLPSMPPAGRSPGKATWPTTWCTCWAWAAEICWPAAIACGGSTPWGAKCWPAGPTIRRTAMAEDSWQMVACIGRRAIGCTSSISS